MQFKKLIFTILLVPTILMAWGFDSYICKGYTTSHDFTILNDTLMFAAYNDANLFYIYKSIDTGRTWASWYYFSEDDTTAKGEITLDYITDSIVLFFLLDSTKEACAVKIDYTTGGTITQSSCVFSDLDSIISYRFRNVHDGNAFHFYAAVLGKSGDSTILEIRRSDDHGEIWNTVIRKALADTSSATFNLLDFAAVSSGNDTIKFVYTLSYSDTSTTGTVAEIWQDVITQSAENIMPLDFIMPQGTSASEAATLIYNDIVIWSLIQSEPPSSYLHFAWTTDNGQTINDMPYPYDSLLDYAFGVDIAKKGLTVDNGFSLVFKGVVYAEEDRVCYQEFYLTGDTLEFRESFGFVSDTSEDAVGYYWFGRSRPRIKVNPNLYIPAVMWDYIFIHWEGVPFHPVYDSTYLYLDYMGYTHVKETKPKRTTLQTTLIGNNLYLNLPVKNNKIDLTITDITGRSVLRRTVLNPQNSISLDVSRFKKGIYFVIVKDDSGLYRERFIKTR